MDLRTHSKALGMTLLAFLLCPILSFGQQVIQRGPFGKPAQVLDETQQWSTPLLVSSNRDVEIYIPDVTATDWLSHNYSDFQNRGTYTLSLFTLYKTIAACRANLTSWGMGDAAHLDSCKDIGYRIREVQIDPNQKSVQILMAAMVDQNGKIDETSIQQTPTFKTWDQLDSTAQEAILKANALVTKQMRLYDVRMQNNPPSRGAVSRGSPK